MNDPGYDDEPTEFFASPYVAKDNDRDPQLVVIDGPTPGASYRLDQKNVSIGRRDTNAIRLTSTGVSKVHCIVGTDELGNRYVLDRGSTNGTYVNGRMLDRDRRLQLTPGDLVKICETTFFFLGPPNSSTGASSDLFIDVAAAQKEAEEVIGDYSQFVSMARDRRRRRKG